MSDSPLRRRKIMVKCPNCNGHKGVYGRNAAGHPATLPCERCPNSSGEIDFNTLSEEEKTDHAR